MAKLPWSKQGCLSPLLAEPLQRLRAFSCAKHKQTSGMIEIEITNFQSNAILCFLGHATWHAARFRALEHDCHMPRSLIWIFYWKPLAPPSHGQVRVSEGFPLSPYLSSFSSPGTWCAEGMALADRLKVLNKSCFLKVGEGSNIIWLNRFRRVIILIFFTAVTCMLDPSQSLCPGCKAQSFGAPKLMQRLEGQG